MFSALTFPATAVRHWQVLKSFVWRELAARYTGSLIGRLWPILQPIVFFAIYHFVFATMLQMKMGDLNPILGQGWVTTFYLLSGILPWLCFAESLARGTGVVLDNSNLITKVAFPTELLPTYIVGVGLVHFLLTLVLFTGLYVGVHVVLGSPAAVLAHLAWLPLVVLLQMIFTLGLIMILATFTVFVRDFREIVPLVTLLWMFVTPIFYPISIVERDKPELVSVMKLNPVYHLLEMYRSVFRPGMDQFPWRSCLIFSVLALVTFAVGHAIIQRAKGTFADEV